MNRRTGALASLIFLAYGLINATALAQQPARFDFVFEGTSSDAQAAGYVVLDLELLPNPGGVTYSLPNPAVLDLQVTVTGATSGNGTFSMAEFGGLSWSTGDNSGSLDLRAGQQLVGQPAPFDDHSWGPPCPPLSPIIDPPLVNPCGRFLLEGVAAGQSGAISTGGASGAAPVAPGNDERFIIRADGGTADEMQLTSMIRGGPSTVGIPALSPASWVLMATLLLAAALIALRIRS